MLSLPRIIAVMVEAECTPQQLAFVAKAWADDEKRIPKEPWIELRSRIFTRDGFKCVYCGGGDQFAGNTGDRLECDHVIPISRGGLTIEDNLVTACKSCNGSKKDSLLSEWRGGQHAR